MNASSKLISVEQLNETQRIFVSWNAERLGLTDSQSFERFQRSWNRFEGGFGGGDYRDFNVTAHEAFRVLHDDSPGEVMASYQVFAPLHFLRMLSYGEPKIGPGSFIVQNVADDGALGILDFGCGLAQQSRALARYFKAQGRAVTLYLADIPTIRKDFLLYLCARTGIDCTFLDCTEAAPVPQIPAHQLCIATEFFEHVYDPVRYFRAIDQGLANQGILVTNSANHNREFMHVTPDLSSLREALEAAGYQPLKENRIFVKKV